MGDARQASGKMRRKELADAFGIGIETLRYYEKIGLIEEPERDANGYRAYPEETAKALRFIKEAKKSGFSLSEIRGFFSLLRAKDASPERIRSALDAKIGELSAKAALLSGQIALLEEMKANPAFGSCETIASLKEKP